MSKILKVGVGLFGMEPSFRIVTFNFGQAEVLDNSGAVVDRGNLNLEIAEANLRYNFAYRKGKKGKGKGKWFRPFVGYRYMSYKLPRIVYEFEDENGDPGQDDWVYRNESKAQSIGTQLHMLGAGFENLRHTGKKSFAPLYSLALYAGAGKADFSFRRQDSSVAPAMVGATLQFKPGFSLKLSRGSLAVAIRFFYEVNASYFTMPQGGEILTLTSPDNDQGATVFSFGQIDLYHGFAFAAEAKF